MQYKADRSGTILLVIVSVLFGIGGLFFASQATAGVAAITFACLLAIFARIEQAGRHHNELMAPRRQALEAEHQLQQTPEPRAKVQRRQSIAAIAAVVVIGGTLVIGFIVNRTAAKPPETLTAEKVQTSAVLTVKIEEKSDAWWIENETNYQWNVCWAERMGQRAIVPAMNPKATVAVRHDQFARIGSAHQGSDLRVTCSYDGTDVASPLTISAVVKP